MDLENALALSALIVSVFAFLLSAWTAIQAGRVEFERRRQELLTRVRSFEVLVEERADAWRRLVDRLDELDPQSVEEDLQSRWAQLRERMDATQKAVETSLPKRSEHIKRIEDLPLGLVNRIELECSIGEEERLLSKLAMKGWDLELAEDCEAVTKIEASFAAVR